MRYGFDKVGGFIVVDEVTRVSAYAYRTSIHASAAGKSEYHAEQIARRMIDRENAWAKMCHAHIVEESYVRNIAALDAVNAVKVA